MSTAGDVKNAYRGIKEEKKSLMQLFPQFMQQQKEKNEIEELSAGRLKHLDILGKVIVFMKHKFKRSDMMLDELRLSFIVTDATAFSSQM